mgnify:CR=1 FL=1
MAQTREEDAPARLRRQIDGKKAVPDPGASPAGLGREATGGPIPPAQARMAARDEEARNNGGLRLSPVLLVILIAAVIVVIAFLLTRLAMPGQG